MAFKKNRFKKLSPAKTARKTAKFRETMKKKRALRLSGIKGMDAVNEIPLDLIPSRPTKSLVKQWQRGGSKKPNTDELRLRLVLALAEAIKAVL